MDRGELAVLLNHIRVLEIIFGPSVVIHAERRVCLSLTHSIILEVAWGIVDLKLVIRLVIWIITQLRPVLMVSKVIDWFVRGQRGSKARQS